MKSIYQHGVVALAFVLSQFAPMALGHGDHDMRYETITLKAGFYLNPGAIEPVRVTRDGWRHVVNVHFQVEAYGQSAWLSVSANGTTKGNFLVPASDPGYLVTIGEAVRSIEVQNTGGGRIYVRDIKAVVACPPPPLHDIDQDNLFEFDYHPGLYPEIDRYFEENKATSLARAAILIVKILRPFAELRDEYVPYLLPIKLAAGRVLYIAESRGILGEEVRPSLEALVAQIVFAKPCTDALLRADITFELGVRLLALKEKIKDLID